MMYRPLQEGKLFAKNKYLADLTDKVKANKDWDFSDFQAGPVEATTYEGKVGRRPDHHRAGGPLLPQGPAREGRPDAARRRPSTS